MSSFVLIDILTNSTGHTVLQERWNKYYSYYLSVRRAFLGCLRRTLLGMAACVVSSRAWLRASCLARDSRFDVALGGVFPFHSFDGPSPTLFLAFLILSDDTRMPARDARIFA